jgi:hypothetical protein
VIDLHSESFMGVAVDAAKHTPELIFEIFQRWARAGIDR